MSHHDMESDDSSTLERSGSDMNLTGFLFGNIGEDGKLETDVLDSESQKQLSNLCSLAGLGKIVEEISGDSQIDKEYQKDGPVETRPVSAVDYSDINELIDDKGVEELMQSRPVQDVVSDEEDYDEAEAEPAGHGTGELMADVEMKETETAVEALEEDGRYGVLHDILAPELKEMLRSIKVTALYPEFQPGKVLRFTRLFGTNRRYFPPNPYKGLNSYRRKSSSISSSGKPINLQLPEVTEFDDVETDDEVMFLSEIPSKKIKVDEEASYESCKWETPSWRQGPAKLWFDAIGASETGRDFEYGFKKGQPTTLKPDDDEDPSKYEMLSQTHWEDNIIWDGKQVSAESIRPTLNCRSGWVVSSQHRTARAYEEYVHRALGLPPPVKTRFPDGSAPPAQQQHCSMFPAENYQLIYGNWEKNVIWDPENMDQIPEPMDFSLDPNDENIILGIPEDDEDDSNRKGKEDDAVEKDRKREKRSKVLLSKQTPDDHHQNIAQPEPKHRFNLSNDEYYNPKMGVTDHTLRSSIGVNSTQHSTPAMELRTPYFPTHMGALRLRRLHRPLLKKYSHGPLSRPGKHCVLSLTKHIRKMAKQREQERAACGGGEMFFMRTSQDLSGTDGEVILAEYSEEYPVLINQIGMAVKMRNFYRRKPGKDIQPRQFKYGDVVYAHTSPFLGSLSPGSYLQGFENNMFRAPVYNHAFPETDFLVIRTRNNYYIREIDDIYCVGQLCPLIEVPPPNSKKATNFFRDFLQATIYRLFWKSSDEPRRIRMEDVRKSFPAHAESSVRKRLKICSDFKRTGTDSNWWVIRSDFRLPTEEEIRNMVSPEQCCAYYSMLAAEQRLKDQGYGENAIFAANEDDDESNQVTLDDEQLCSPWNTTRAFLKAIQGKCLLEVTGVADPTGCSEGFSYIRVANKPQRDDDTIPVTKKSVTGTDADLRKLSLKNAKQLLRDFGIAEDEIKKLSRWEVIDVVRTMSTQKAKQGAGNISKFARGSRFSLAEHQERYREECQRIFDLQNKVLSSSEVLSSEEGSDDSIDSDIDQLSKNVENILDSSKTTRDVNKEMEEQERKQLKELMMSEGKFDKDKQMSVKDDDTSSIRSASTSGGRKLKIYRTYRVDDKEFVRVETVRKTEIIETYVKVRESRDLHFIRQFASYDDRQKEELRREKRRIQDQLRRIKKSEGKEMKRKPMKEKPKKDLKMKCGACGQMGHMRTNRECPYYDGKRRDPIQVAMTEEQEEEVEQEAFQLEDDDEDLVKVEGTKITLGRGLVELAEKVKQKSLTLKIPKEAMRLKRRRKAGTYIHCDYLTRPHKLNQRRRADPIVTLCGILESILNQVRDLKSSIHFHLPVNSRTVKDYYTIIKTPMDLQTMRHKLQSKEYRHRDDFMVDLQMIRTNCAIYNGEKSPLTEFSQAMVDFCIDKFHERDEKLSRLEKLINPLLDDNPVNAFSFILDTALQKIKFVPNSWPFHKPVNPKNVPDYYRVIAEPMDLDTMSKNLMKRQYRKKEQFLLDVDKVVENSRIYNGPDNVLTTATLEMRRLVDEVLLEHAERLASCEAGIQKLEEKQKASGTWREYDVDVEDEEDDWDLMDDLELSDGELEGCNNIAMSDGAGFYGDRLSSDSDSDNMGAIMYRPKHDDNDEGLSDSDLSRTSVRSPDLSPTSVRSPDPFDKIDDQSLSETSKGTVDDEAFNPTKMAESLMGTLSDEDSD